MYRKHVIRRDKNRKLENQVRSFRTTLRTVLNVGVPFPRLPVCFLFFSLPFFSPAYFFNLETKSDMSA